MPQNAFYAVMKPLPEPMLIQIYVTIGRRVLGMLGHGQNSPLDVVFRDVF